MDKTGVFGIKNRGLCISQECSGKKKTRTLKWIEKYIWNMLVLYCVVYWHECTYIYWLLIDVSFSEHQSSLYIVTRVSKNTQYKNKFDILFITHTIWILTNTKTILHRVCIWLDLIIALKVFIFFIQEQNYIKVKKKR